MRYEDLPANLRKQVDAKLGKKPSSTKTKQGAPTAGVDAHCATCGEPVTSEAGMTRHREATGHGRYEIIEPFTPPPA